MVLQNKYKAKASRRYNSSKGATDDTEAGSSKPGYRHKFANKHAHASTSQAHRQANGSETAEDEEAQDSVSGSDDDDQDEEDEDGNAEFPSLAKAATASTSSTTQSSKLEDDDPSNPSRGKYARRRLGESKLARLERLEAAKDPRLPDDEEPEPEVDISNLVARVAALGDSAGTQAGMAEQIARSRGQHETASDVENDIDHSLAYLHEKERQRQKAKGHGGAAQSPDEGRRVTFEALEVDADGNAIDLEALKKEKEKAEAVRALKARFQGHGVGERSRSDSKPRSVPSIQIGPGVTLPITSPSAEPTTVGGGSGGVSDSLTAEIESSLAKSRSRTTNGETGSINSGRSSFSTTFGRRKSPLAGVLTPDGADAERGGSAHRTERIDSFLASLNDRSLKGNDPSVFQLSPVAGANGTRPSPKSPGSNSNLAHQHHHHPPQKPIHSSAGELGRLENFLDDMLG